LRAGDNHARTWASFGGHARKKETPRQTALREFREETGFSGKIELSPLWIGSSGPSKNPEKVYHLFIGFVSIEFDPKLNKEHYEARWFSYDAAKKLKNKHPKLDQLFTLADSELKEICRVRPDRPT
jgi:8-oxo-dGTP pyrophosphatase MutT (NUDIX family)